MKKAFEECGVETPEFKGGPGGEGGRPNTNSAAFKKQVKEYVACVRENGYELAEPDFSGEGPIFDKAESESAAFKKASEQCQELLGGPQGLANPAEAGAASWRRCGSVRPAVDRRDLSPTSAAPAGGERPSLLGQPDPDGAAVVGVGDPLDQAAVLGPVDQAGDARLVELEVTGEGRIPGSRSRRIPSRRIWTTERSWRAATRRMMPWTRKEDWTSESTRARSSAGRWHARSLAI